MTDKELEAQIDAICEEAAEKAEKLYGYKPSVIVLPKGASALIAVSRPDCEDAAGESEEDRERHTHFDVICAKESFSAAVVRGMHTSLDVPILSRMITTVVNAEWAALQAEEQAEKVVQHAARH